LAFIFFYPLSDVVGDSAMELHTVAAMLRQELPSHQVCGAGAKNGANISASVRDSTEPTGAEGLESRRRTAIRENGTRDREGENWKGVTVLFEGKNPRAQHTTV
jgi:hypothetical protein